MRIATVATGGIGGFLASILTRSGHQVATIARGAHLAAIQERGLTLEGHEETTTIQPWKASSDGKDVGVVDAIIFGVKGDGLPAAAEVCRPMLGPETIVVPFLNGVEAAERLAAILPPENVGDGVAYISTTVAAPGVIRQTGAFNRFVVGERDNRVTDRIKALRSAIEEAGSSSPAVEDIRVESWKKFVLFSAMSGVTAAARCTVREILSTPPLSDLFREVIGETASVGRALGVALPDGIETAVWEGAQGLPPNMRASTAVDLEHGRPLEIEWVSGAVVRLGREAGVDVPANRALYALLSPYRSGRNG